MKTSSDIRKCYTKDAWWQEVMIPRLARLYKLKETASKEERIRIDNTIHEIYNFYEDAFIEEKPVKKRTIEEQESLQDYHDYFDLIKIFETKGNKKAITNSPKVFTTTNMIYETNYDFFYKVLPTDLFRLFELFYDEHHIFIGNFPNAESTYLDYFREVFILSLKKRRVEDFASLAHECGHGISYMINRNKFSACYYNRALCEIESMFFEHLMYDYLRNYKRFCNPAHIEQTNLHQTYFRYVNLIMTEESLFKKWEKIGRIDCINKMAMNAEVGKLKSIFKTDSLEGLLDLECAGMTIYILGHLMAIELLMLYFKDKDKALEILIYLISQDIHSKEEFEAILKTLNIELGRSLEEYEAYLKDNKSRAFTLTKK